MGGRCGAFSSKILWLGVNCTNVCAQEKAFESGGTIWWGLSVKLFTLRKAAYGWVTSANGSQEKRLVFKLSHEETNELGSTLATCCNHVDARTGNE